MFRIVIDGQEAVTDQQTSVDFFKQTQFFWLRKEKSHTYSHSLPVCDINNRIFKFAHKLHKREYQALSFSVQYYKNGSIIFAGTLKISKTTDSTYEVFSGLDDADIYVKIKGKSLREFEFGGRYYFAATNWDDFLLETLQNGTNTAFDVYYTFPVLNKWLYENNPYDAHDPDPYQPNGDAKNLHLQNNFSPFYGLVWDAPPPYFDRDVVFPDALDYLVPGGDTDNYWSDPAALKIVSPFLKVNWVLEKFFTEVGYTIKYNFFKSLTETKKLCIYHNREISGAFNTSSTQFYFDPNDLLPDMLATDFISSLEHYWGVSFWFDSIAKTVDISPVIKDFTEGDAIPFDSLVSHKYVKEDESIGSRACLKLEVSNLSELAYANKLPTLPVPIIQVSSTGAVASPVNYQVILVEGDGYYIYGIVSKYPTAYGWQKYKPDDAGHATNYFNEYCTGNDADAISLNCKCSHPLQNHWVRLWYGIFIKRISVPYVNIPMVGAAWENTSEFGLQLMIYEGMAYVAPIDIYEPTDPTEFDTDRRYAWGRVDLINASQNVYPGSTISLKLDNDEQLEGSGMIANFLQDYMGYIGGEYYKITRWKHCTPEELSKMNFRKKYRIDQINYIIIQAKLGIQDDQVSITELSVIKIN